MIIAMMQTLVRFLYRKASLIYRTCLETLYYYYYYYIIITQAHTFSFSLVVVVVQSQAAKRRRIRGRRIGQGRGFSCSF